MRDGNYTAMGTYPSALVALYVQDMHVYEVMVLVKDAPVRVRDGTEVCASSSSLEGGSALGSAGTEGVTQTLEVLSERQPANSLCSGFAGLSAPGRLDTRSSPPASHPVLRRRST